MENQEILIIAEVAQAHDGSLGILHSYIDALAPLGVNAVKFQTHIAEAESSELEPFRVNFTYEDKTRYDYWKRMQFSEEQWQEIRDHCQQVGLEFISSPFSNQAVDLLERLQVKRYKIGSGEVTNTLLLEKIARTGKQVILSSGMSSFDELDGAVSYLGSRNIPLAILQCTTAYPTAAKDVGLNVINELKERYGLPVGLSDHSSTIFPCLAAVMLGIEYLEFHVVFDKEMFGPDTKASLNLRQTKELVEGVRYLETCLNNPIDKNDLHSYQDLKGIFEKSLAVNKDMKSGDILKFEDLEGKKPSNQGIPAGKFNEVIGRKLKRDLRRFDFLNYTDLI
ncbi:MAG: N-acetylneuraminate synthase family protein [Cyclobacteriaceae bacterium]|nr:N-acetylneuraminate synthase family protein [Cyclobacteriaceae bacterium]